MDEKNLQETKVRATKLYQKTWQGLKDPNIRIILHQGGSRSSKTVSIMQCFLALAEEGNDDPFLLNIARKFMSTVKDTILRDFDFATKLLETEYNPPFLPTRNDQRYYVNGCEFNFIGLDDPQRAHGMPSDYFWGNEAIELSKADFDQVEMRTRRKIILDFNPSDDSSWIFDLLKRPDVMLIKSTILDNPFVEKPIRQKILGYEPTEENVRQGTSNSYMWEVYGLGNKAKLEGLVFPEVETVDAIPDYAKSIGYGLDFGYNKDPAALVQGFVSDQDLWLDELIYETHLTNKDLYDRMKLLGVGDTDDIFADSAEPKSIEEIYRYGLRGIQPVTKGADSINFGIGIMTQYRIHITTRSINGQNEVRKYVWATDRSGNSLNKPIDFFNHFIDAARYLAMMKLKQRHQVETYNQDDLSPSLYGSGALFT